MENLFVLPTDKPSRLIKNNLGYGICPTVFTASDLDLIQAKFVNIYITNSEEIKEGEWVIYTKGIKIHCKKLDNKEDVELANIENSGVLKIILTTDQELIKDGVQAIDNEFLEWFVKNPSCEKVEIFYEFPQPSKYKIIIPKEEPKFEDSIENSINIMSIANSMFSKKEEPKQETLEEAKNNAWDNYEYVEGNLYSTSFKNGFEQGAKWQQERSYSEEEMLNFAWFLIKNVGQYSDDRMAHFEGKYLEKFKNK
jgi:hypothetical protein